MSNTIELKPISELLGMNFYIPSYQRGYRWTKQQVKDLLNDIQEFIVNKQDGFYCIQPLVVKHKQKDTLTLIKGARDLEEVKNILKGYWEVIDGQQRLTTVHILLTYLQSNENIYTIEYETRPDSKLFLLTIKEKEKEKNIDYHHMFEAKETIREWFADKDKDIFAKVLLNDVKFIWYESMDEVPIKVFTRLNMGKIKLTNAELVKALLLSKDTISENNEELRLAQLQIATEWDLIENQLNNESFWAFVTNEKQSDYPTKIGLLLELSVKCVNPNDEFSVFNQYYILWKNNNIKVLWEEQIVSNFEIIKEWYNDHELYHLVGYLMTQDTKSEKLKDLLEIAKEKTKKEFANNILQTIKNSIEGIAIENIKYPDDNAKLHKILTLFNVLTVMNAGEKMLKYPFALHKNNGGWSLEHIHAQKSTELRTVKDWRNWLEAHNEVLKKSNEDEWVEVSNKVAETLTQEDRMITKDIFDGLFDDIRKVMSSKDEDDYEVHGIENMALLSKGDNSVLSNAMFAVKRKKILGLDKNGSYIPICTRNVFLKYYNKDAKDFTFWSPDDRVAYLAAIRNTLTEYLPHTAGDTINN